MKLYRVVNSELEKLHKLMRFAEMFGGKIAAGKGTVTLEELKEIEEDINVEIQAQKSEAELIQSKAFLRLVKVTK